MKKVYLDYAATSPVKKEVMKAMMPYFSRDFGNASSIHSYGRKAKTAIDQARVEIAKYFNAKPEEIIFTSGGTESDNLAVRGIIESCQLSVISNQFNNKLKTENRKPKTDYLLPHIITSEFEHHAVLDTCKELEKRRLAEVTYIKPNKKGLVSVDDIKKAIKENTILISIMYVNNEIGTIQPIQEIAKAISRNNELRIKNQAKEHNSLFVISNSKIYFHTDAVQATEYLDCDVKKLGVDLMSVSAHKFGGPKGVGALYIKKGTPIARQNIGGAQEHNLRGGTYNTPGIIGMAKAIQLLNPKSEAQNPKQIKNSNVQMTKNLYLENSKIVLSFDIRISKLIKLRDYFIDRVLKEIPDTVLNGDAKLRSPNNVNISFKYIEGEAILLHLDMAGIAASSGSACTSGSLDPSHVLLAIGLKHEDAHGSIRFTLGDTTTKQEIDYTVDNLKRIVKMLREMSPFNQNS